MSARARVGIALAALVIAAWLLKPRPETTPPEKQPTAPVPVAAPRVETHTPVDSQPAPQKSTPGEVAPPAGTLNERTLVGTQWERDGFRLEFGADGRLLIGGRERARWRVEGSRIRLYRETTGEEHWLDIAGNKLMWEGQELGRVQ
ncbi:MAG: hypothetical protein AB1705_10305 [Verrucomicrobiota bacterium]